VLLKIFEDKASLGKAAAAQAAIAIRQALGRRGSARILAAAAAFSVAVSRRIDEDGRHRVGSSRSISSRRIRRPASDASGQLPWNVHGATGPYDWNFAASPA
jgi:hypothetical protein